MDRLRQRVLAALAQAGPGRVASRPPARSASSARTSRRRRARSSTRGIASPCASTSAGAGRSSTSDTMNSIGRSPRVALEQRELGAASPTARPSPAASCRSACPCAAARSRPAPARAAAMQPGPSAATQLLVGQRVRARRRSGNTRDVHRLLARAGQIAPQLVGRERQDRRQQARQAVGHQVHRRLRRAPLARPRARTCRADPSRRRRRTRSGRPSRTRSAPGRSCA